MSKFKAFLVSYQYPGMSSSGNIVISETEEDIKEILLRRVNRCHPDKLIYVAKEISFDQVMIKDLTLADLLKAINN